MLASIQAAPYRREVTIVLQMLLWSNQRLTLEACNDAVIVQPQKRIRFCADERFFDPRNIVDICSGLVTTVRSKDIQYLQLSHASVREYLSSQDIIPPFQSDLREASSRASLLRLCQAYLCSIDWSTMGNRIGQLERAFPLADWAASTWPEHARFLDADALASVLDLLQQTCVLSKHFLTYSIAPFYWADRTQCYPLYFAAFMGLRRACIQLLQTDWANTLEGSDELDGSEESGQRYKRPTQSGLRPAAIQKRLDASLLAASTRGYDTIVQDLLDRGARPDAFRFRRHREEYTALQLASKLGHTEVVRVLIKSGALIDYNVEPFHRTAMYEASESGHVDIVEALLTREANPEIRSGGWSPLRVAVFYGHVAVAKSLISAGVDLDSASIQYDLGFRPRLHVREYNHSDHATIPLLMLAVREGHESMIQLLLDNGFSVNHKDSHGRTALHKAVQSCDITIIRMLLDRGALIDAPGPKDTVLTVAVRSGRHDIVQTLLDHGADLSDGRWHVPVFAAVDKRRFDIVDMILLRDVHINDSTRLGTALYQAAWGGLGTLVKVLLKHGAKADDHEESTRTPLQIATAKCHPRVVRLLIKGGADIDRDEWAEDPPYHDPTVASPSIMTDRAWLRWLQTHPGSALRLTGKRSCREAAELLSRALTPLQIAVILRSSGVVKLLLDSGANPNKGQWLTPLQIAVTMGYHDIVEKLLRSGAYLNNTGPDETLLGLATRRNHETTAKLLIRGGAAVGSNDETRYGPLQLAALYGHVRTMQVLLAGRVIGTIEAPLAHRADFITESQLGSTLNIAVFAETYGYDRVGGYDHLGVIRLLLDQGFLNKCDWIPALHHVVQQGYTRYLRLFLEHGVDVNESYAYYWRASIADTPQFTSFKLLRVAAFHGHEKIVRLLLHCGAEIDDTSQGNCALASAAAGKQESMMLLLAKRGAKIDLAIQVARGWTNSNKITRRLHCLQASATSPPDHFAEWQEHGPLCLLNESYPQPLGEKAISKSQPTPFIVVGNDDASPSPLPIGSASPRRHSKISPTVSRLRCRLSRH
jgi:ankyrin repeat protein